MEREREEETAVNSRRRRNAVLIRARPTAVGYEMNALRETGIKENRRKRKNRE